MGSVREARMGLEEGDQEEKPSDFKGKGESSD